MSYALPNRDAAAEARLAALAELFDPRTCARLESLGLAAGWRVWEVGAGGPTLVRWLAERGARVLATDVDTSRLAGVATRDAGVPRIGGPGRVEVRAHDVGRDLPPEGPFELIHARLVLVHVVEREIALRALVGALAPGGWLVIEDADPSLQPLAALDGGEAAELANRVRAGFRALLTERGVDLGFGRTLPRRLRELGLAEVGCEAYFPIASPACAALERATIAQTGERLVSRGLVTAEDLARHVANIDSGRVDIATSPMVTAWGRSAAR